MRFESGMIGCLIVVLAIGGAVFGNVLLSADTHTETVTKYDFKTEVTGLFDTDTSPQFFDYDISKNYTGYYTVDSIVNGIYYWGGAEYTPSSVNNYPITEMPVSNEMMQERITLAISESMDNTDPPGAGNRYTGVTYYDKPYGEHFTSSSQTYSKTLTSFIREYNLNGYDVIEITPLASDYAEYDSTYENANMLFFGTTADYNTTGQSYPKMYYVEYDQYNTYPQDADFKIACHSCKIDTVSQKVSFYYGDRVGSSTYVYTVSLSNAVITFKTYPLYSPDNGIEFKVTQYDVIDQKYMDTSQGVKITGVYV